MSEKGSILNKVKYFVGLEDLDEGYEEEMSENQEYIEEENERHGLNQKKVYNIHTANKMKLVIHEPETYEDILKAVDDVKARKAVVLNLLKMQEAEKRNVFDFANGAVYTLEGNIQKVATDIFVLAPSNVEIDGILNDELKTKGIFPWKK